MADSAHRRQHVYRNYFNHNFLDAHNAGRVPHTADGRPWIIDAIVEFSDGRRAVAFEKYLKSGSGYEFARRHLR